MNNTFIIAEAGVNHNGSIDTAMKLIDVAAEAGVDAIKFQTFRAEKLVSRMAPKAEYQTKTTDTAESQLEMLKKLELDEAAHNSLIKYCKARNVLFISTPFDLESLDLLINVFDLPQIKIPSGEITNGPLLLKAARSGKKIILSTGMSNLGEVETALGVLAFGYTQHNKQPSLLAFQESFCSKLGQRALLEKVVLLHCTTEYPVPYAEVNLRVMDTLRSTFGLPVGLSDHSEGIAIPIAAVARGADIIEKHFTLDRNLPGPDHKASLEPAQLKEMVQSIRQVEEALGNSLKIPAATELKNRLMARKSLVAVQRIKKGEMFSENNISIKRPGTGISPMNFWDWLGKVAERDYEEDEVINP